MSRVKIEGNASGTGTLTISAPSTNTDRTLTLPDEAGEFVTADSSGNVGIGTDSPDGPLTISAVTPFINLYDTDSGPNAKCQIVGGYGQLSLRADQNNILASSFIGFDVDGSERMRIDSSGNLLVGTTANSPSDTAGIVLNGSINKIHATRSGGSVAYFNRLTSDGNIIDFVKDGTTVGSISIFNTNIGLAQGNTRLEIDDGADAMFFTNNSDGALRDNTTDLGKSNARLDDIYATNGTIQTSDQNEKQQIASLTDAEMNVAKRLSALFKTFKWNSSVEEKGDNARTHTGIIAQDMQQAFTDEGLDAGNYAMFISSTWWETSTDVPAVEAVDAVYETVEIPAEYDDEGNEISPATTEHRLVEEAVEAKDAYTRIDTFETQEEAPEGATERTRLGVRYPELFAFINAYNDQRFEALETRIEALENA